MYNYNNDSFVFHHKNRKLESLGLEIEKLCVQTELLEKNNFPTHF